MKNAHGRTCKKTKVYIYLYISPYENVSENGCVYIYIYIYIYICVYIYIYANSFNFFTYLKMTEDRSKRHFLFVIFSVLSLKNPYL